MGSGDRKDAIGSLGFFTDTVAPTDPTNLVELTSGGEGRQRVFTWTRSRDPGFPNTGSGVGSYNIKIRGAQTLDLIGEDSVVCNGDLCMFTTPELRTGAYTVQVSAVDRATNESGFTGPLEFFAGFLRNVQNLQVVNPVAVVNRVDAVNISDPTFQWNPPVVLPDANDPAGDGGIETYEVAITGDFNTATPFTMVPFTPFTDEIFLVECSGSVTGTGDQCIKAIVTGDGAADEIRIKVVSVPGFPGGVPDGTHRLSVRVVPKGGLPGESELVDFTVDTITPGRPDLILPNGGAKFPDTTPEFVWTLVTDPSGVTYTLEIAAGELATGDFEATGDFINPVFRRTGLTGDDIVIDTIGAQTVVRFTLPDPLALGEYKWHVQAVDAALNTGDFSRFRTFEVIAVGLPVGPPTLAFPGAGDFLNDNTPFFIWQPSTGDVKTYQLLVTSGDIWRHHHRAI